jgi:hypothetical protein
VLVECGKIDLWISGRLEKPRRLEVNIQTSLRKMVCEGANWVELA